MQEQQNRKVLTIEEIKNRWNAFSDIYKESDKAMQTFYFTLANMLKLPEAKHILEIACGLGRLIPYAASIKSNECTYLASDIAQKMIQYSHLTIQTFIKKLGVTDSVEQWLEKQNISFKVINGEQFIQSPFKFDRIICNLVLMLTQNPKKMLVNLGLACQKDGLLGMTIWGDKAKSNFLPLIEEAFFALGKGKQKVRQNFYLYKKIEDLIKETGWELVIEWQQNAPFNHYHLDSTLQKMIRNYSMNDEEIINYIETRVVQIFQSKNSLNFPTQMAILRKL